MRHFVSPKGCLLLVVGILGCNGSTPSGVTSNGVTPVTDSDAAASPDFAGAKAGDEREVAGIKLCWCPPGRFRMGSPGDESQRRPDETQVDVTLTQGFWMGKYEVTQGQWKRIVGKLPGPLTVAGGEGDGFPVYNVNYAEAEAFCRQATERGAMRVAPATSWPDKPKGIGTNRNRRESMPPTRELPAGWEFRLPTEAQ